MSPTLRTTLLAASIAVASGAAGRASVGLGATVLDVDGGPIVVMPDGGRMLPCTRNLRRLCQRGQNIRLLDGGPRTVLPPFCSQCGPLPAFCSHCDECE